MRRLAIFVFTFLSTHAAFGSLRLGESDLIKIHPSTAVFEENSDHLSNVLATILDRKTGSRNAGGQALVHNYSDPNTNISYGMVYNYFLADIASATDRYPGGMEMPGRTFQSSIYRFGQQGSTKENEPYGVGNFYDMDARGYDARLMRFTSIDPWVKKYPYQSPYTSFNDNPIYFKDPNGKGGIAYLYGRGNAGGEHIVVVTTIYVYSNTLSMEQVQAAVPGLEKQANDYWNNPASVDSRGNAFPQAATVMVDGATMPIQFVIHLEAYTPDRAAAAAKNNRNQEVNFMNLFSADPSKPQNASWTEGNGIALNLAQNSERNGTTVAHELGHLLGYRIPMSSLSGATEKDDNMHAYGPGTYYFMMSGHNNHIKGEDFKLRRVDSREYNSLNYMKVVKRDGFVGGIGLGTVPSQNYGSAPTNDLSAIDPTNSSAKRKE